MTAEPTVFVIDDNLGVRRSLQALAEAAGLPVETYASAQEFLERYDPQRPGCMVLDVRLRGQSGLDLQEELRRRRMTIPIIVMTGYGDVPSSVRAFKGGAIDFLQKPVPPKKLLERIRAALEIDHQARATAAQRTVAPAPVARGSTERDPRCASTMERLMASPIPRPCVLVVKYGSKSRATASAATPLPVS